MQELYVWRFMQTDPNWGNFLYDASTGRLALIDFGAAREFPKPFVDEYLEMVAACARRDRAAVLLHSQRLGFLTGAGASPGRNAPPPRPAACMRPTAVLQPSLPCAAACACCAAAWCW